MCEKSSVPKPCVKSRSSSRLRRGYGEPGRSAAFAGTTAREVLEVGGQKGEVGLRLGWPALVHEWREQIDRNGKKGRRVVLAGDLAHGLEEAQLQRNRLLAHHGGGLYPFFRHFKFPLRLAGLGAGLPLALGMSRP